MTRESEDGSGAGGSREGLGRKGVVDVALSVFAEVRPGEGVTALILMLDVFLLLVAYYLLKTVREPLILAGGGVELKNYATAFQAGVLMLFVPAYSAITKRYSRMTVVTGSMLFFASNLVLFWLLALLRVPYVGFAFYVWLGCFSLSVIAQFWSMANDLYTPEQGKRLFAIIGIGSSTGAVAGSFVAGVLGKRGVDEYTTMLLAAGVLVVCLGLSWVANGRATRAAAASGPRPVEEPIGGSNGFVLLMRDRYLLLIALVILLLNLVNTIGETTFDLTILAEVEGRPGFDALGDEEKTAARKAFVQTFRADFFFWVNLVGAVTQLFLVSRIFKYLGIRLALFSLPLIGLIAYGGVVAFPVLAFVRLAKIAENACDYSLYNTTKQALWLPTSREDKYNAKMTIDSFIVRIGDLVASGASLLMLAVGFGVRAYAAVNVVMVCLWFGAALLIGRENAARTAAKAVQAPA
jgi:AAA family ATP:ADP antiporter